jgi:predicted aminopeptidase
MKLLLLLAGALSAASGCATQAGYLAKQGGYLLHAGTGTRDVAALIASPSTPAETRVFLQRVVQVKQFAVRRIGLKDNGNYTRYKKVEGDHLVDVVQACDALSFTPYLWSYPFLGKLPYRGYYERPDAQAEAARLKKEGWDVLVRPVDAFSTLGFTKDPVYSFMENYSPFQLASLVIHEQTHATLFLKGQPDFNEELATFVGDEGAFQWLRETYGEDSPLYRSALDEYSDSQAFVGLMQGLQRQLENLYGERIPVEEMLAAKTRIIDDFNRDLEAGAAAEFRTDAYRGIHSLPLNNAYLSLYSLYAKDIPLLRAFWMQRCGGSLVKFMQAVQALSRTGDVKDQLRREMGSAGPPAGAGDPARRKGYLQGKGEQE